jgi:Tfp pilus assembly protein PilN
MIQFNLLPDVKLDFIKAQRYRRVVIAVSFLVTAASVVLLVLLLSVDGLQKKNLNNLQKDIASETSELRNKPNISTILTVQNQLESLTALHNGKPAASRLFTYLNELTPATVSINNLAVDFTQYTVTITGTADTLSSINQYIDTLKLTTYSSGSSNSSSPAFSNVVLSSFSLNTAASAQDTEPAQYTITLSYDKNIFDITQNISLSVPSVTTRAQLQDPPDLFNATPTPAEPTGSVPTSGGSSTQSGGLD